MTPIRVQVDTYRPVYDYEVCPTGASIAGIAAALIAYNVRLYIGLTLSNKLIQS